MVSYGGLSVGLCCRQTEHEQWLEPGWSWQVEVHVAELRHNLHPCHRSHFVLGAHCVMTGVLGKESDCYCRMSHPISLIIKILLCRGHPLVSIHVGNENLHVFCPLKEVYPQTSSPNFFVTNFPRMVLPSL